MLHYGNEILYCYITITQLHYIKNMHGYLMWNLYELQKKLHMHLQKPNVATKQGIIRDLWCERTNMAYNVKHLRLSNKYSMHISILFIYTSVGNFNVKYLELQ